MAQLRILWVLVLVSMGILVVVEPSWAESSKSHETLIQHLEFLGYQCEKLDQGIKTTHPSKLGFLLVVLKDGLMAQAALAGKTSEANSSEIGANSKDSLRFSVLNELNKEATISRFFWTGSGELVMRASMLGTYEKGRFYTFIEAWEKDGQAIGRHYEELKAYLK
jgi:hypothetical protein